MLLPIIPLLFLKQKVNKSTSSLISGVWTKENTDGLSILIQMDLEGSVFHENYGAPEIFFTTIFISHSKGEIHIEMSWFNKTATRLPESIWMIFKPIADKFEEAEGKWRLNKLGYEVDPLNVIINGSKHLHGIDKGVVYHTGNNKLKLYIDSLDVSLVSPGKPLILEFLNSQPDLSHGMAFNLMYA